MAGKECILTDPKKLREAAAAMVSMFDREIFDYVVVSDSAGAVLGSIVARDLKSGIVLPCMDVPGGKCIVVGFDLGDGKKVKKQTDKIREKGGTIVKMGFFQEEASLNTRKTLFRGIPVESVNIL